MKLRSDRPYWPSTYRRPSLAHKPQRSVHVDVLIVGAGITGALAAYEVSKNGASVAIVDSRPAGSGSTAASTALLQYEIDTSLVKLSGLLGSKHAADAYAAAREALRDTLRISEALGDNIDLVPRRSLHLAVKPGDVRMFRAEVAARRRLGIPVALLSRRALGLHFGLHRPGAIISEEGHEVNPLKLTYQLLRAARELGVIILPRMRIDLGSMLAAERPFRFDLSDGGTMTAARVVIATGYETPEQFKEVNTLTELRATFALATMPLRTEPWPERALLWDAGDPYFYARTTHDGRVVIGGEDEPFTTPAARDALIAIKSRVLMKKLRELLPHARVRPAFRWAGTFAQTKDGLPYIGEHIRWPGVWFALGYGGNGITFSVLAAKIIAATVSGRVHPAAKLFRFDR